MLIEPASLGCIWWNRDTKVGSVIWYLPWADDSGFLPYPSTLAMSGKMLFRSEGDEILFAKDTACCASGGTSACTDTCGGNPPRPGGFSPWLTAPGSSGGSPPPRPPISGIRFLSNEVGAFSSAMRAARPPSAKPASPPVARCCRPVTEPPVLNMARKGRAEAIVPPMPPAAPAAPAAPPRPARLPPSFAIDPIAPAASPSWPRPDCGFDRAPAVAS